MLHIDNMNAIATSIINLLKIIPLMITQKCTISPTDLFSHFKAFPNAATVNNWFITIAMSMGPIENGSNPPLFNDRGLGNTSEYVTSKYNIFKPQLRLKVHNIYVYLNVNGL